MRTDSFSKEKHLPVRRFIADESKVATGLYGPHAIADDLDNIFNMFDPDATFLNGNEHGGIGEKNLQSGAVSYDKLAADVKEKFQGIATENQLSSLRTEILEKTDTKAEKATSLSGYGITDAYTKDETDSSFLEVHTAISRKMEEKVLYEGIVDTLVWSFQPTYDGTLDDVFNTDDFYYVTLKDAKDNALPAGQFMLKDFYTEDATVYSTVFHLADLDTGSGILVENYPVEFTSIGATVTMRDAGVQEVSFKPDHWNLTGNQGNLRLVCDGEFIQRTAGAYFITSGSTDKNVSHFHSVDSTAFQNTSTKQIVPYAPMGTAGNYKDNSFYDEIVMERLSSTRYLAKRNVTLRATGYSDQKTRVISQSILGHGTAQSLDTLLTKVNIQVAVDYARGCIRNGSVIRVTEVK